MTDSHQHTSYEFTPAAVVPADEPVRPVTGTEFSLLGPTLSFDEVAGWIEGHGLDLDNVAFVQFTPAGLHAEAGPTMEVYNYVRGQDGDLLVVEGSPGIPVIKRTLRRIAALPHGDGSALAECNPAITASRDGLSVALVCGVHRWMREFTLDHDEVHYSQIAEAVAEHLRDPHDYEETSDDGGQPAADGERDDDGGRGGALPELRGAGDTAERVHLGGADEPGR